MVFLDYNITTTHDCNKHVFNLIDIQIQECFLSIKPDELRSLNFLLKHYNALKL